MPAYDDALFIPPAPLARVLIRNPETGNAVSGVSMLLESGADVTLLPEAAVSELQLAIRPDEAYELIGFDGSTSLANVVRLEMIFLNRTFRGRFLVIDQEWGIMGRDVLNLVRNGGIPLPELLESRNMLSNRTQPPIRANACGSRLGVVLRASPAWMVGLPDQSPK